MPPKTIGKPMTTEGSGGLANSRHHNAARASQFNPVCEPQQSNETQPSGNINTGKIKEAIKWKTLISLVNRDAAIAAIKEAMETLYSCIFPGARFQMRSLESNARTNTSPHGQPAITATDMVTAIATAIAPAIKPGPRIAKEIR